MVVAFEVAETLHAELDVFVVRKLGVPDREELAMGAIASGNVVVRNVQILEGLGIPEKVFEAVAERERKVLIQHEAAYRGERGRRQLRAGR